MSNRVCDHAYITTGLGQLCMTFLPGILPGVENDVLVRMLTKFVSCVPALVTFSFADKVHAESQCQRRMNNIHVGKTDFLISISGCMCVPV
jgi:hypothetical protein